MTSYVLPWPSTKLSPNGRLHWAVVAKVKAMYRYSCRLLVREQRQAQGAAAELPEGSLAIELVFFAPDRRKYDRDNLVARLKAGLDGLCDALQIDDSRFAKLTASVSTTVVKPDGQVLVTIKKADE